MDPALHHVHAAPQATRVVAYHAWLERQKSRPRRAMQSLDLPCVEEHW